MKFIQSFALLFVISFLSPQAMASGYSPVKRPANTYSQRSTMVVTTLSLKAARQRQIEYCKNALILRQAQRHGRLMGIRSGLGAIACGSLLKNQQCKAAFINSGSRRASQSRAFGRITRSCVSAYCTEFRKVDQSRFCQKGQRLEGSNAIHAFFTAALRHDFLKSNDINGLRTARELALGLLSDNLYSGQNWADSHVQ